MVRPDAQFVRPNYQPDLIEQQRLQQYFNQQRNAPLNDGFHIANDNSRGTVVAVDGQSRSDYDKMIQQNFKYTQDNYGEAYKEAARTGKPVVAIFGGFENNNSRSLVQQGLPEAQNGAAKDAVYIYVDRAKCKDGPLAQFADSQLAGGHNAAVSIVFSVKPGKDGSPEPEAPNFRWQGSDRSMIGSFNQAITEAQNKTRSYDGQFKIADSPEKQDSTEKQGSPRSRIEGSGQKLDQLLKQAEDAKDWHQSERLYQEAIKVADGVKPQDIQAESSRIGKELQAAKPGSPQYAELMQASDRLRIVADSKWTARAELGLACMDWANEQPTDNLKHQFRDVGSQWIKDAARRNPGIYSIEQFKKLLADTHTPSDELKTLLPELTPLNFQPDYFKYGGDGNRDPNKQTPEGNPGRGKPAPDVDPAKGKPAPEADSEKTKQAKKLEIIKEDEDKAVKTEAEYYAALKAAADKGLPVIVKIGSTSCGPCKKMAPYLKEAEAQLQGKAVVVRVLAENTPELADSLGAGEGVPITMVAGVVRSERGQLGLVPLKSKVGFSDKPDELSTFINDGLPLFNEWKKRPVAAKR